MRKMILSSYAALLFLFALAFYTQRESAPAAAAPPRPAEAETSLSPAADCADAPDTVRLLIHGETEELSMRDYLVGVVAAEMPADFEPEALKAQAVAARSYTIYCTDTHRHAQADICADSTCCQAWISAEGMRKNWGSEYEQKLLKIKNAVLQTDGEYLSYDGKAVFAAFHSSSAGKTEASGAIWSERPYLQSVDTPESADTVPNFESSLELSALDFRDTILHARPEADFTGAESDWVQAVELGESGRVEYAVIGGAELSGTELRSLFSLRSTRFTIENTDCGFKFTVLGFGHGVGMSQYGAQLMAGDGADYREILAHYYPGTQLAR